MVFYIVLFIIGLIFLVYRRPKCKSESFSLVTYNILCQKYNTYRYSRNLSELFRFSLIFNSLGEESPTIICLQELNSNSMSKYLVPFCLKHGYTSYHSYNSGNTLINAILVKDCFSRNVKHTSLDLSNIRVEGNRGIQRLDLIRGNKRLTVFNCHFPWKPTYLLYQIFCLSKIFYSLLRNETDLVFIAGDLNSLPSSPLFDFLVEPQKGGKEASLDEIQSKIEKCGNISFNSLSKFSAQGQNEADLVEHFRFLAAKIQLKYTFKSVFQGDSADFLSSHTKATNKTDRFQGNIDYIFHSTSLEIESVEPLPVIPDKIFLPNRKYPSDHLRLKCKFKLN